MLVRMEPGSLAVTETDLSTVSQPQGGLYKGGSLSVI